MEKTDLAMLTEQGAPDRKGKWMRTFTHRRYWPVDPRPEDVYIEDIAHHLSMLCRYTGACPRFYSVAEHSYLMSFIVPREHQLCGLLHDASEAYLGDVGRPLKVSLPEYYEIEALNWAAIAQKFGLPARMPQEVKVMDSLIIKAELRDLDMDPSTHMLEAMGPAPDVRIKGWEPAIAEALFMQRYQDLVAVRV